MFKVRLVGVLIRKDSTVNASLGQGLCKHGYQGFGLEELLHEQAVGCSENASMVPNAATPIRTTTKGPSVFLFINPYKSRPDTAGILEKFNRTSTSSVTRPRVVSQDLLYDHSERFILS